MSGFSVQQEDLLRITDTKPELEGKLRCIGLFVFKGVQGTIPVFLSKDGIEYWIRQGRIIHSAPTPCDEARLLRLQKCREGLFEAQMGKNPRN